MTQVTIERELLLRAIRSFEALRSNMGRNAPHLSGKVWGDADRAANDLRAALQAAPAQPVNQGLHDVPLPLLERLSKTLTNLGYATPEGGMEAFGARLEDQLYSLCRGVDGLLAKALAQAQAQTAHGLTQMVDAAMVEMSNIVPPLKRSECERLIRAAVKITS